MELSGPQKSRNTTEFRRSLLRWFDANKRTLPWRNRPTPYRIWIAEVMLQQTRVAAVIPAYERFLERFPDVTTLASALERDVLAFWAGLGYYSRARSLRKAARRIVNEFGGNLPSDVQTLRHLPGIGRYTAGAICSIAFNQPQPVVDGNVRRVLTRLHALKRGAPESFFWKRAAELVSTRSPSDFNQAIMELGAVVCLPANPLCGTCPVQRLCGARQEGAERLIPRGRTPKTSIQVELVMLVMARQGRVLLTRQPCADFIPGIWHLPVRVLEKGGSPFAEADSLSREILRGPANLTKTGTVRHNITSRRILAHVYRVEIEEQRHMRGRCWVNASTSEELITSSLYRKALDL